LDAAYITPFVESIESIFRNNLRVKIKCHTPVPLIRTEANYDVSGIISFNGEVGGVAVICLGEETAAKLVTRYSGMEIDAGHLDFADAVGELLNVIAGNAKSQFEQTRVNLGCPSVVLGKGHRILRPKGAPVIEIPCESDCGPFAFEVTIVHPAKALQSGGQAPAALSR